MKPIIVLELLRLTVL